MLPCIYLLPSMPDGAAAGGTRVWVCSQMLGWCGQAARKRNNGVEMKGIRGEGKTKTKYPDYTETASGIQYKDVKVGSGDTPKDGERVVIDW